MLAEFVTCATCDAYEDPRRSRWAPARGDASPANGSRVLFSARAWFSWGDVVFVAVLSVGTGTAKDVQLWIFRIGRIVISIPPRIGLQAGLEVRAFPALN